ncbi:MAG: Holliday junction resolvase RuvX [Candidatus Sungiibacteriota bacterium]
MGIDYGARRIGVARSDENGMIAFPLRTIEYRVRKDAIAALRKICDDGIEAIVMGLPIGLDGKETDETEEVRQFAADLAKAVTPPIYFENEMLTSRMAYDAGMRGGDIDASSAAIILQSYLDRNQNDKIQMTNQ